MSPDPLDAKTVQAADPDPSGSDRASMNHPRTDAARRAWGQGIEANIVDIAGMSPADIDRKLDDLETRRG